ncbi:MAG TPA: AraC family transcriptional regulator [Vicinamibacterales bacterium]
MSDPSTLGVVYTEFSPMRAGTPIVSLWSFHTTERGHERRTIAQQADGTQEFWLERSDPLLNTILPGMGVSIVVNFGDLWAAGRSLATSELIPRVSVIGPCTQPRILRVGRSVHALGAVLPTVMTPAIVNVPPSALVDRIVPLHDLWIDDEADRLLASLALLDRRRATSSLKDALLSRIRRASHGAIVADAAAQIITVRAGNVSIADLADRHGLSRHQFARRFTAATGVPPKLFARIARFQALVPALLATDVSQWASLSSDLGFYDQAHMINEFHTLTGAPPTTFFQPHDTAIDPARIKLRGRPSEWTT